ncbi:MULTISPECIES: ArsR/SmtB family transcription factor [Corynebacterium]|uniref:Transcriptional regulator n=3 Tax=Corynebacterium TaxID=1716 RepID=A0ABD0BL73_CORUL|nr:MULTISPECIES: MarR family transcriptional regulator [Corynebacterium]AEG82518.1 ArsR-family transcription regulator [Corynebacterium ulcerans 809]AEG84847.1 ArsR-family transcription regulator [Corynebacterium ulcerans BR-AD22]AIT90033.1 Transcriptional regulatory protein [Corynebacterium ulcerans]AIU33558.1 Transcriptional regulatory protein [Corynebacterium ramonii FRC0011]AKN77996.1 Transcriptional regulatory protein [Corynebacterium ulcerans FRC58]
MYDLLEQADDWSGYFKLMGDRTRLRILVVLHYAGPRATTVTEIAEAAGVRVPTASGALRAMEHMGAIKGERFGREVRYSLVDERIHGVLHDIGMRHGKDKHRH